MSVCSAEYIGTDRDIKERQQSPEVVCVCVSVGV